MILHFDRDASPHFGQPDFKCLFCDSILIVMPFRLVLVNSELFLIMQFDSYYIIRFMVNLVFTDFV